MLSNTHPTTSGIPDMYVDQNAPDEIISLYAAFDDAEDADEDLTYEVVELDEWVESGYGSLFDDVYIDGYGGDAYGGLVLDFAENASGDAEITVRATDTYGAWVQTTFLVYVASGNDAPTTSGIADVYVDEDAVNETISLYGAFADIEDPDGNLTYEVVENTNSSLFDSMDIDGYGGLVLDFAADAFGTGYLTVRATDSGGLWVETTFAVDVAPVNDAPVITDFGGVKGPGDGWTFSGEVTDVDDNVEGMIVVLGGVLEGYNVTATVQADGTFSLTDYFPGLESGTATAQTEDDASLESNVAWYLVTVA